MKKIIIVVLLLHCTYINIMAQTNGDDIFNLSELFNENDCATPIDDERYFTIPNGLYSHKQVLNIPASSRADLLHKVLIIVDSTLYSDLTFEINRYAYDIHYVYGCNVIMEQVDSETCQDIKALILNHQTYLDGCVFIGDIVPAWYKTADVINNNSTKEWPCDLYYMDLTGIWTDSNQDGFYDQYSGDKKPEIFVGRISTSNMGSLLEEIEGMRIYLNKNHKFWIGHRHINKKFALSYTNKDWVKPDPSQIYVTNNFRHSIDTLYGSNNYDHIDERANPDIFGKTDYMQRLQNERYEFVQLASHSRDTMHTNFGELDDTILGNEMYSNGIKSLGFNLFCCSACRWTSASPANAFMAGDYVYSPISDGLCVVGSTKVGGMYPFVDFYKSLREGNTIGQALVDWWSTYYMPQYTPQQILCWNFGLTIIGDPLVNFYHCTNSACQDVITLTTYDNTNSPLSYYLASEKIQIPSSASFVIPVKDHCILNAPTVEIHGEFFCPGNSTLEVLNEGCQDNCDEE